RFPRAMLLSTTLAPLCRPDVRQFSDYDPRFWQPTPTALQVPPTGPPMLLFLQCPKTASSGRRLILVRTGGSYLFLDGRFSPLSSIGSSSLARKRLSWYSALASALSGNGIWFSDSA